MQGDEARWMDLHRQEGGDDRDGDEEDEEQEGQPRVAVREQHGDRHDRAKLSDGPHRQDRRPQFRLQDTRVAQDRQEGPERRRRKAQRHDDVSRGRDRWRGARAPRPARRAARLPRIRPRPGCPRRIVVNRAPCPPGTSGRSARSRTARRRWCSVHQIQHKGPQHDAEQDLDHDLGHRHEAPEPLGNDRREHRGDRDEDQRRDGARRSCCRVNSSVWPHAVARLATSLTTRYAVRLQRRVTSRGETAVDALPGCGSMSTPSRDPGVRHVAAARCFRRVPLSRA